MTPERPLPAAAERPDPPGAPPPSARGIAIWIVFLTLDTLVQLAFKAGGQSLAGLDFGPEWFERASATPAVWVAVSGYIVLFVVWMVILQGSELTRAFTLTGIAYVTVPLGGWLVFGETINFMQICGIAAIMIGVTLISRSGI